MKTQHSFLPIQMSRGGVRAHNPSHSGTKLFSVLLVILALLAIPSCKHGNTGTLEPEPEQVVYTVTFDTDGGSEISAKSVNADEAVAQPDSPTKTGFVFDGWYTDSQLTTAWDFETKVTQDITLYAKWKILVLNVTFFTDGGTEISAQEVNYNETAVQPESDPTKENCTFDGWYTDRTYSTEFDFTTEITQDITIYAKWIVSEESFEVKFETSGGSDIATQVIKENQKATKPATDPTKAHFKFGGWYVDEACSLAFDFDTELTEATTIYARWIELYTVTFNTDGGTTVTAQEVEPGTPITEPSPAPTKSGYKFLGWYSNQQLTTTYDFSAGVYQNLTIYAKWNPLYTITFSGADVPSQSVEKGEKVEKPADPVSSEGSLFAGWYINDTYTAEFDFDSKIYENKTIYAKWIDSWTVTFSGASDIQPVTVKPNKKVTKPANPADQNNKTFDNWYADAAFTTLFDFDTPITADTTVYAKWLTTFTVSFDSVGGSEVAPVKVVQGKTLTKPADPTRGSRPFDGWYTNSAYTEAFDFATAITRDTTLYAKWAIPEGVELPLTITVTTDDLDVTQTFDNNIYSWEYQYTFTCNTGDGVCDWYVNNVKKSSNTSSYMFTRTSYNRLYENYTVEARKQINGIWYSWTAILSM